MKGEGRRKAWEGKKKRTKKRKVDEERGKGKWGTFQTRLQSLGTINEEKVIPGFKAEVLKLPQNGEGERAGSQWQQNDHSQKTKSQNQRFQTQKTLLTST